MEFSLKKSDPFYVFGLPKKLLMEVSIHSFHSFQQPLEMNFAFVGGVETRNNRRRGCRVPRQQSLSALFLTCILIVSTIIKATHSPSRRDNGSH